MKTLRVMSAKIRHLLGIEEMAVQPGRVTIMRGKNETAKTSMIEGIRAALGGGTSLSRYQRIDTTTGEPVEEEPEVLLEIGPWDGKRPSHLLHREGDELDLRERVGDSAAFKDVKGKPQTLLSNWFDGAGCNPVTFLQAPDKERVRLLLEALPLMLDEIALAEILGDQKEHLTTPIPSTVLPLEHVAMIRSDLFNARTGVNRDLKSAAAYCDQLRRDLPAELPERATDLIQALEAEVAKGTHAVAVLATQTQAAYHKALDAAKATKALEDEKVTSAYREASRKLKADLEADNARSKAQMDEQIAALRASQALLEQTRAAEVETALTGLREADGLKLDEIDKAADAARAAADEERTANLVDVDQADAVVARNRERLAALRVQSEDAAKVHARADLLAKKEEEEASHADKSAALTETINKLDAFARRMAEDIPIEGLTIADRVIKVKGVPFTQLNTAQRIAIAVKVASLRAADMPLPVLFVDGAEALDSEHFEVLVDELLKSGMQAFITRVEDHETVVEKRD